VLAALVAKIEHMRNRLINIHQSDLDKKIYRVMPVHRLFELFESKRIALVQPSKWDDPFENLLLKGMIEGIFEKFPESTVFRNFIYGQCWTTHRETDAMWRIYSQDKSGVKIRCSIRNLLSSITEFNTDFRNDGIFIGKVDYLPQKTIFSRLSSITDIYGREAAKSLLLKRQEFKHEAEIRLICTKGSDEVQKFEIDPNEVIEEIVFDPRMNEYICNSYMDSIKNKGFSGRVAQSAMYRLPRDIGNGN